MKKYIKWLLLALIAFVPSFFISRSETLYNSSPCLYTEVCQANTLGTKEIINYGFPASYAQTTIFTPTDSSKHGVEDQGGDKNFTLLGSNMLFWAMALNQLFSYIAKRRSRE